MDGAPVDDDPARATALFEPAGADRWVPTDLARGPWDPSACHGGPVAALLARAVELVDGDGPVAWQIARTTVELVRPVPVGRVLSIHAETERPGTRVSLVAARLHDGDTEVARVRALRIRTEHGRLPAATVHPGDAAPGTPAEAVAQRASWAEPTGRAFHTDACEHRFTEGAWDRPGPVGVWIRLLVPVVDGEEPTGVQRAVAAADFGNGVSAGLPYEEYVFINPDLTVHLIRPPAGEWIGMRTASYYGSASVTTGAGMAESALYDESGRVGRSVQSLFLDAR